MSRYSTIVRSSAWPGLIGLIACLGLLACDTSKDPKGTAATPTPPSKATTASTADGKPKDGKPADAKDAKDGKPEDGKPAPTKLSKEQLAFYQKAFPKMASATKKTIPKELIRAEDQANDTYLEAFDASNVLLGYLRDFEGPVTFKEACACNPLKLTLAFSPGLEFKTIISPAPLQKYGHEPMTDAEFKRLLEIVADPNPKLMETPTVEAVVDATSGATKKVYQEHVVAQAALSTRRIAALVRESQQALAGAPLSDAQRELNTIMLTAGGDPAKLTSGLAAYLKGKPDIRISSQVYPRLAETYAMILEKGGDGARQADVEAVLLKPGLNPEVDGSLVAMACEISARAKPDGTFTRECIQILDDRANAGMNVGAQPAGIARGLVAAHKGDHAAVIRHLGPVLKDNLDRVTMVDPDLVFTLIKARAAKPDTRDGICPLIEEIAVYHARHPELRDSATKAGCANALTSAEKRRKENLVASKIPEADRVTTPTLALAEGAPITPATFSKPTVVLFFATWCPHCQREMPHIVEFAKELPSRFKDKAGLFGVRTATARETEPYDAFATRFKVNFPVRFDTPDARALSTLADAAGLTGGLPTLLVFDNKGRVAYNMAVGPHSDTPQDLTWALEDLLAN